MKTVKGHKRSFLNQVCMQANLLVIRPMVITEKAYTLFWWWFEFEPLFKFHSTSEASHVILLEYFSIIVFLTLFSNLLPSFSFVYHHRVCFYKMIAMHFFNSFLYNWLSLFNLTCVIVIWSSFITMHPPFAAIQKSRHILQINATDEHFCD